MTAQPQALLEELAREILHNYGRGRRLIGVDGADPVRASRFAEGIAQKLGELVPHAVERAGLSEVSPASVAAFRAGEGDALLVVDGPLLGSLLADAFSWTLWVDSEGPGIGGPGLRTSADAIVDDTDPAQPVRRFSDWCVVPRR